MTDKIKEITFDSRDEYQRKPIAEKIIRLLESDAKVSPMVIDGGWGTGKTEFCHKLINLIESGESKFKPVYVDAFSADHADEPLMTLLAAILKLLPEKDRPSLIKKALPAIKFGMKIAGKAGFSWLLKQDAADVVEDFDKDIQKAADAAINHSVESLLKDHVEAEKSLITLKNALKVLANETPIVIFVDELDRCRPDFSVSMLESIKHVFDVEGVQFVLVTNSEQLRASINHSYGIGVNAQRYLDKFLGFSFVLPYILRLNGYNAIYASVKHLDSLIEESSLLCKSGIKKSGVVDFAKTLVKENNLSLREVETLVRHLEIYHTLVDGDGGFPNNIIVGYALLRVLGVYIFCFKPVESEELVRGHIETELIAKLVGKSKLSVHEGEIPKVEDMVVAIVEFESIVSDDNYTMETEDEKAYWKKAISPLFHDGWSGPDDGEMVNIVVEAIETLKLGR